MSVPNGPINRKYTHFRGFLILLQTTGVLSVLHEESSRRDFGVLLGSFGDFGMTFRSLCAYEGDLGIILVDFLEILIFPIDFNDFI